MRLPEGYRGAVVEKGEPGVDRDVEVQNEEEVGALHDKAAFDEVVVWGHESIADSAADPYVRGVEEWISFAEQVSLSLPPRSQIQHTRILSDPVWWWLTVFKIHAYPAEQGVASK